MKRLIKSSLVALMLASLVLFPQIGNAEIVSVGDAGRAWSIPDDAERGMHVQQFLDSFPNEIAPHLLDPELRRDKFVDPTCKGMDDPRCTSPRLEYMTLLPVCASVTDLSCIEEFGLTDASGTRTKGTHLRYIPNKPLNEYVGSPALRLPTGTTGSVFNLPDAAHDGGTNYYVSVRAQGSVDRVNGASIGDFSIRIFPVKLETGDGVPTQGYDNGWRAAGSNSGGHVVGEWINAGFGFSGKNYCVAGSASERLCAQRYAFPAGKKFYLKVRLQNLPSGWLHGRIYQPEISINQAGTQTDGYYNFDISAFPVAVPVVYKMYRYPEMPQALKDQYDVRTGLYKPVADGLSEEDKVRIVTGGCGRSACSEDPLTRNVINSPTPSEAIGMEQLKLWLPFVEDKATTLLGTWSMRTLDRREADGASQCFVSGARGVTGIVTTNATQYSAGPPSFNKEEGTLEYKVAAPHFTPKGQEFSGTYDLLMRSDVARCVYGFSNAPIKASLSIVNNGENQKIATENLGERNGWVFLSAAGFTFSDPTIKVKLTQDPPPVPTPSPTPTPTPTTSPVIVQPVDKTPRASTKKRVSITCVKGSATKKVIGVKPKCPKGFKKA